MDGQIGRLHSRYRVFSARGGDARGAVASWLEDVRRGRLATALSEALEEALGGDEVVYVVRRVRARVGLSLGETATDARIARRWGEQLAGAVVRAIAADTEGGANLMRFETQADYVAHFAAALLSGDAWRHWYFAAFMSLRAPSLGETLRRVLFDNRPHLPEVLALLHTRGQLDALLAALDAPTRRDIWEDGRPEVTRGADPEAVRPLFALALGLVDDIGAWAAARPGKELLQSYLETSPPDVDWHDRHSLAAALFDVLLFLERCGRLRREAAGSLRARLDAALEKYDWLDADWLEGATLELLGVADAPRLPARRGATPRQRELLETLGSLFDKGGLNFGEAGFNLSGESGKLHANAIRLYAALVSREPSWADDAAAKVAIQHLLTTARLLHGVASPDALTRRLRQGDAEGALQMLAEGERAAVAAAVRFVAALGEPVAALLEKLGGLKKKALEGEPVESACAGMSLLLRTIMDARLHVLATETGRDPDAGASLECQPGMRVGLDSEPVASVMPPVPVTPLARSTPLARLILALGMRMCGEGAATGDFIDEGLCVLAGLEGRPTLDELRAAWAEDEAGPERLQDSLLRVSAGQRLMRAGVMHLYCVELEGGASALVAADESAALWLLGGLVETGAEEASAVVAGWVAAWEDATGERPLIVADESIIIEGAISVGTGIAIGEGIAADESISVADDNDVARVELLKAHEVGRAALSAALAALNGVRLGLPGADLSVALAACSLLRLWARWLKPFSASSVPYLLENFMHRRGRLYASRDALLVELECGPLDIVIETAGYLAELEHVQWLGGRRLRFRLRGV